MMDGADFSTPAGPPTSTAAAGGHSGPRPSLGFPLGTALLLIIIFCLSGVFSCCYHWDKLRFLCGRPLNDHLPPPPSSSPAKLASKKQTSKVEKDQSLPVIMPGDSIPKFMAWPSPCQSISNLPATEKIVVISP